jgi:hypothetical protein
MSQSANHGFALFEVDLEFRGDQMMTRSRPLNINLSSDEPVMNPRGMLLEYGATLLEKGQARLIALTNGVTDSGEPQLDFIGYMGACKEPYFHDVQPCGLYNMTDAFYRVSLVKVSFDASGYHEELDAYNALFAVTREGILKPFEIDGAIHWPQELLDAVRDSTDDPTQPFQMITADDVQLDTLYYRKHPSYSNGQAHLGFDCFVACRTGERSRWLIQAKEKIRGELTLIKEAMQSQLDKVTDALHQIK